MGGGALPPSPYSPADLRSFIQQSQLLGSGQRLHIRMGPCIVLVAVTVCLSIPDALGKPLGALTHDDFGVPRRVRRSLPASIPYDADIMSYVPSEALRNEPLYSEVNQAMLARLAAYPQEELLAQALEKMGSNRRMDPVRNGPSLQQLMEESQRRDKETLYLANLLHMWNQINQGKAYADQLQGFAGPVQSEVDYQKPYPDYDETEVVTSRTRPQASRNQMEQALRSYYRQSRGYDGPAYRLQQEEVNGDGYPMDEEMLRYLVTRVLSAMNEAEIPPRLPPNPPRRMRRSLEDDHSEDTPANLLRVKRLDTDNPDYPTNGMPHRKRGEGDAESQRGSQHFTDQRVAEQLLKYFPE
ncbi:proSAAS [Hyperolius riggenbachi]|uniref:proSAAS n=1 Tax=Hyperolius riggenbachi TaxID=752182 RepID=UPI0035A384C9